MRRKSTAYAICNHQVRSCIVVTWIKEEMESADMKKRKLLTMHGDFHFKSSTKILIYTSWKEGR